VLVWLFMLGGRYSFISLNGGKSNVSELMTVINDTANKFKEVNGEFGYSSDPLSANDCLTGNGFMRSPEILSALSVPETSTIRCVYEIGDGVIRHYSVSVQIGDAVYCTDSRNRKVQTQGFTVTTQCNGK